jgi:hypothetical protein
MHMIKKFTIDFDLDSPCSYLAGGIMHGESILHAFERTPDNDEVCTAV